MVTVIWRRGKKVIELARSLRLAKNFTNSKYFSCQAHTLLLLVFSILPRLKMNSLKVSPAKKEEAHTLWRKKDGSQVSCHGGMQHHTAG